MLLNIFDIDLFFSSNKFLVFVNQLRNLFHYNCIDRSKKMDKDKMILLYFIFKEIMIIYEKNKQILSYKKHF